VIIGCLIFFVLGVCCLARTCVGVRSMKKVENHLVSSYITLVKMDNHVVNADCRPRNDL